MRKWIGCVLLVAVPCIALAANQSGSTKERNARLNEMFKALDVDKSGKLSQSEVEQNAPAIAENFDQIDADHDSGLTKKELKDAFALAEKRRSDFNRHLSSADKDKNGKLSREEAQTLPNLSANFDAIDSNHDGQLVIKEIADFIRAKGNAEPASSSAPALAR
ncbi:MAG: hypothetical protein GW921_02030 [Gallionella sp.]|nr:hypothetical protein [Gallionella sp.]